MDVAISTLRRAVDVDRAGSRRRGGCRHRSRDAGGALAGGRHRAATRPAHRAWGAEQTAPCWSARCAWRRASTRKRPGVGVGERAASL